MSEVDLTQSVIFGDFSTDEVQTLLDAKDTAVKFTNSLSSHATEARVTVNQNCIDTRTGQTGSTSPEFQFTNTSLSLSEYAHAYQFGSPAQSSMTSPSTLSTANSSMTSLNSSQSGQSSAKLNVFAKEFIPNVMPPHLSIISKGDGVMGGAYPIPPILAPPPFIIPPYAHPTVMFIDPSRPHYGTHIRPPTVPQVAVVAPYRAAHEPRPLLVIPAADKYCTNNIVEENDEGGEGEEECEENNDNHDQNTKLISPVSDNENMLSNENSSVNENSTVIADHVPDTPANECDETTPTHNVVQSETQSQKSLKSSTVSPTPPPNSASPPLSPSEKSPSQKSPSQRSPSQKSPSQRSPSRKSPPHLTSSTNTQQDTVECQSNNDTPTSDTILIPINAHTTDNDNNSLDLKQTHSSNNDEKDENSDILDNTLEIDNKLNNNNKRHSPPTGIRSWAAVVGTPTLAPLAVPPTRKVNETKSSASKLVGVVEISKEERIKVDELKQERLKFFGNQIEGKSLNHAPISILPRGLLNNSNLCYIHAPLQALISCPELTHLLRSLQLPKMSSNDPSSLATIVTENMIRFIGKFQSYPVRPIVYDVSGKRKKPQKDFSYERPFRPDFIYEILPRIKSQLSVQGRQEDAEEFLGCFLNKFHEELVAARQAVATPTQVTMETVPEVKSDDSKEEEEEWQEVGPKNKSTITRQMDYMESPISQIFGGRLHTCLHRQGTKMSATVEPFFSLQLDIQPECVKSVKDALDLLASKETVNLSEKDGNNGTRRTTLIHLPHVLILHLKRFIFDGTKSHKLHKHINHDYDLEIPKDLLAPSVKGKLTTSQRSYKLWAVVYHCGETPNGGHYICEAYHQSYGGWLRYDDNYVKPTNSEQLFRLSYKVPYLFFYRQVDSY